LVNVYKKFILRVYYSTVKSLGYYLYAEASYPRQAGDKARLVSGTLTTNIYTDCYVRFYYHMTGRHIGKLSVKTRKCVGCVEDVIWQRTTPSAIDNWVRHSTFIHADGPFEVLLVIAKYFNKSSLTYTPFIP